MNLRIVESFCVVGLFVLNGCATWSTSGSHVAVDSTTVENRSKVVSPFSSSEDKAEAHYALGKSFVASKEWSEAMKEFNLALSWVPWHVDAANGRGLVLAESGRFQEAAQTFEAALLLKPDSAVTLSNLSYVLLKLGHLNDAAKAMREAYDLNPKLAIIKSNWTELLRLSVQNPEHLAMLERYPLGATPFTLKNPVASAPVVAEIVNALNRSSNASTAVINITAFPGVSETAPNQHVISAPKRMESSVGLSSASSATVVNLNYELLPSLPAPLRQNETFSPPVATVRENSLVMAEPPNAALPQKVFARVEIVNGNGTLGAASRYSRTLTSQGLKVTKIANAKSFAQQGNVVYYLRGQGTLAKSIASELPGKVHLIQVVRTPGYDVRVVLGRTVKRTLT